MTSGGQSPAAPAPVGVHLPGGAEIAAVALGGAVGTLLRAGGLLLVPPVGAAFPLATLGENLLGAFLLGGLAGFVRTRRPGARRLQLFLGPGVLGSFTTFSALMVDAVLLGPRVGAGYLALSVLGGVGAAALGIRAGGSAQ